jgi:cytochrome c2
MLFALTLTGLLITSPPMTLADGDAAKGKRIYNKCKACHVINKKNNRIGPHLVGLFGRKAGSVKKFRYSKAMKNSGITWDEKSLDAYLQKPRSFIKGNRMAFPGLRKKKDRDDLIAYLKKTTLP